MQSEFTAALAKHAKQTSPCERVLWRGADAKGFPAWWLVRVRAGVYGLLGKLGKCWTWFVDARDAVFATIPDEHFEAAIEIASRATPDYSSCLLADHRLTWGMRGTITAYTDAMMRDHIPADSRSPCRSPQRTRWPPRWSGF